MREKAMSGSVTCTLVSPLSGIILPPIFVFCKMGCFIKFPIEFGANGRIQEKPNIFVDNAVEAMVLYIYWAALGRPFFIAKCVGFW